MILISVRDEVKGTPDQEKYKVVTSIKEAILHKRKIVPFGDA